jgi:GNAT superfamily N-acetyltransferase
MAHAARLHGRLSGRSPVQLTVRPAGPQDADDVAAVLCESRRAYLPFAPMVHTPDEVRAWIAEVLIPAGGVYVATRGAQVVAMLAISHGAEQDWIDQLYVKPGHTGQGIGAQLLQAAHARLSSPVRLYTFQANVRARRFYENHGYRVLALSDGSGNEERCPDVLYEWRGADA